MQLAGWLEEGVRRLLREAALGALGSDLGTAADESLIATGLAEGDAEISVSAISSVPVIADDVPDVSPRAYKGSPAGPGREAEEPAVDGEALPSADEDHDLTPSEEAEGPSANLEPPPADLEPPPADPESPPDSLHDLPHEEETMDDQETRIMEPVPAEDEIRITATNWLDEVSAQDGTMEWTAAEGEDIGHRERVDTPRVRHLFQVPEDADWEVRELNYDHYRQAG
jgi:hypothetical protein